MITGRSIRIRPINSPDFLVGKIACLTGYIKLNWTTAPMLRLEETQTVLAFLRALRRRRGRDPDRLRVALCSHRRIQRHRVSAPGDGHLQA